MNRYRFQQIFHPYWLFHTRSVLLVLPWLSTMQLTRWSQKWYLVKLVNGWWVFTDVLHTNWIQERIASQIYGPSYISLERALSLYNIIPEWVFMYTSVCTRKTQSYVLQGITYTYQKIDPRLYVWYETMDMWWWQVHIWCLEKVILDYLYLHTEHRDQDDFAWLRRNTQVLAETLDRKKLEIYASMYPKTVQDAIAVLVSYIDTDVWFGSD